MTDETSKPSSGVSLRELTQWVESFEALQKERDKRYEERHNALDRKVDTAFVNASSQVSAALNAAQRASDKAEESQRAHNLAANEWRGTLEKVMSEQITRKEVETMLVAVNEKVELQRREIGSLRESRSAHSGADKQSDRLAGWLFGAAGFIAAAVSIAIALGRG